MRATDQNKGKMVGRFGAKGSEKSVLTQYAEGTLVTPPPAKMPPQVLVGPTAAERRDDQRCWQRNSHTFKTAVGTFLGSGCICINDVIPKEFIQYTLGKVTTDYNFLQSQLSDDARNCDSKLQVQPIILLLQYKE